MSVQTTYPDTQPVAVAGAQATMIPTTLISRTVEVAAVGFGVPVEQGIADKGCKKFDGGKLLGITALDRSASGLTVVAGQVTASAPDTFGVGQSALVMTKGDLWVIAATAVAAGDDVYIRPSNGDFQNDATNSATVVDGLRWDTTTVAGGLAVLRMS